MNKEIYWEIIDKARHTAGDWKDMERPLLEELKKLDVPDIIAWGRILAEYRALSCKEKLWAAAATMMNGCSDDSFEYFRGWLIAQGKDTFLSALEDPDSLADTESVKLFAHEISECPETPLEGYQEQPRFENILYVACIAYEQLTGKKGNFYDLVNHFQLPKDVYCDLKSEIHYANDIDAKWYDDALSWCNILDKLKKIVPKIYQLFQT